MKTGLDEHNLKRLQSGMTIEQIADEPYQTFEGKRSKYSSKEQKDAVVRLYLQESDKMARESRDETGQDKLDRDIRFFSHTTAEHPEWKSRLQSYPQSVSIEKLSDSNLRKQLSADFLLYKHLKAKAPGAIPAHTTEQSRDFFNNALIAQDYFDLDDEQSFVTAVEDLSKSEKFDELGGQVYRDIDDKMASFGGFFDDSIENTTHVKEEVRKVARFLARQDLDPTLAVKEAFKRVEDRFTDVNGHYIKLRSNTPENFADTVETVIDDFADSFGEVQGYSSNDLTIREFEDGVYALITKTTGTPVSDDQGLVRFTMADIRGYEQDRARERKDAKIKEITDEHGSVSFENRFSKWIRKSTPTSELELPARRFPRFN